MKSAIAFIAACTLVASAAAQTYVRPHVRSDGTWVDGHVRTAPNSTNTDNYGTRGNSNPYTGQVGTVQPIYSPPPVYVPQPSNTGICGYTQSGRYVCR